ncbi:hypothetical protein [Paenibacillus glufosinatiresistens]|uniref:hypothetical protein n=1 Tax=Paenibacillus glufosinatiresistens TaxID=3070657 RepID=UPI00286D9854|nr:hypothetical protein [Paenibacillus sp. YX.27]
MDTLLDVGSLIYDTYKFAKDPSWGNAGYVALDAASALVPFVPSASSAVRAGKALSKVDDGADIASSAAKAAEGTGNNPLRRTGDQQALHDLAKESVKEAKKGNPISEQEAKVLDEWANEYGVPQHHQAYSGSGKHFPGGNYQDHTHI